MRFSGFSGSRVRSGRLCKGGCCRGCILFVEFCMESLHLLHADVGGGAEFQLMHGGGWVEVDIVDEGAEFESECHALKYHFLIEVWCAKGSLTEAVNESPERLVLFLFDAKKGDGCSLLWAVAGEVSGKHVGEGVEVVDGVWQKGGKPFEGRAFKGGREGLAENGIMRSVEGDVGDIDLEVLVRVDLTCIALQSERFPQGRERGVSDEVRKRMTASGLCG